MMEGMNVLVYLKQIMHTSHYVSQVCLYQLKMRLWVHILGTLYTLGCLYPSIMIEFKFSYQYMNTFCIYNCKLPRILL